MPHAETQWKPLSLIIEWAGHQSIWSVSIMMRKIAIGLAAATIAIGGPTLSASALHSQSMKGPISKGSASQSTESRPRTYGSSGERRGGRIAGYEPDRFDTISRFDRGHRFTPLEGERFSRIVRERYAELSPLERERLSRFVRERFGELTPLQRERLSRTVRKRFAELTPLQRERLGKIVRERFAELTPLQRQHLGKIVRERYGELTPLQRERLTRIVRELQLTPVERERLNRFVRGRYEQPSPLERERLYRHGAYGRR
jgi:hypothetical protein